MAVDAWARVEFQPNDASTWTIEGWAQVDRRKVYLSELLLQETTGDLLSAVVQTVRENRFPLPRGARIWADTSAFDNNVTHRGLGSSAALAVALTAALTGPRVRNTIARLASQAHRRFQGNLGSGYDVFCSAFGGLLVVRGAADQVIEAIDFPPTLSIWLATDQSYTHTPSMVRRVVELNETSDAVRRHLLRLARLADEATTAVSGQDAERLVALIRQFCEVERDLGETIDRVIVTDALLRLDKMLQPLGAVCKPSGAGGDELVVIVGPREASTNIQRCVETSGFSLINLARAPQGFLFENTG